MANNYEFRVVVESISTNIEGQLARDLDAGVERSPAMTLVDAMEVGESAVSAGRALIEKLRSYGVVVIRVMPDLVHAAAIARRAGVTKPAVTKWVTKSTGIGRSFPAPYAMTENGPIWIWGDVNEWLRCVGERGGKHKFESWCTPRAKDIAELNTEINSRSALAGAPVGRMVAQGVLGRVAQGVLGSEGGSFKDAISVNPDRMRNQGKVALGG